MFLKHKHVKSKYLYQKLTCSDEIIGLFYVLFLTTFIGINEPISELFQIRPNFFKNV